MTALSFEETTDLVGVVLAIVMVALFAAVDLLPVGHSARRISGIAAGSALTLLVAVVAYRFAVMAE